VTTLVEGRDIRVHRGDATLVQGVDVVLEEGEILGIVGESGAGKTLTVRALLGLLPTGLTATGAVRIADQHSVELRDPPAGWRRRLAGFATVVLQDPTAMLDPMMRVGRQLVEEAGRGTRTRRRELLARASDLLQAFGFSDPEHVLQLFPHQLSGGMAQRVAIAMALVPRPRLIVLDEPTSALDPEIRRDVFAWVRSGADRDDFAAIVITHDLRAVRRVSDRLLVMYGGRTVEAGPTAELLTAPRDPYLQGLATLALHRGRRRAPLPVLAPGARHAGADDARR
jgi:ABC-type glutathione transport system ATPase component